MNIKGDINDKIEKKLIKIFSKDTKMSGISFSKGINCDLVNFCSQQCNFKMYKF